MDPPTRRPRARRLEQWIVPAIILFLAAAIIVVITGNWNTWASERVSQKTDDAYVRAGLTPLSTKVAGLVGTVPISDYQPVKAEDLLVQLRDAISAPRCSRPKPLWFPAKMG
jgi:membrane fusion protein, multidrug efflux system